MIGDVGNIPEGVQIPPNMVGGDTSGVTSGGTSGGVSGGSDWGGGGVVVSDSEPRPTIRVMAKQVSQFSSINCFE